MARRDLTAYRAAADMLARSPLTRAELLDRLVRKGFPREEAESAASRLSELGYLREEELAERLVERSVLERGYGRARALEEMERRGVPRGAARRALEGVSAEDEARALARSLQAWCERNGTPSEASALRRLVGHLRRRGFPDVAIRRAVLDRAAFAGLAGAGDLSEDPA